MATPFYASISSNHDSCISALIGSLLWGVPDLSDGAHVARFGWLVYILSNMSLWGTENCIPSRKCQTVVAGLCWHSTVILFWRIHVFQLTGRTQISIQSACSNKQQSMWFRKIRHFVEVREKRTYCIERKVRTLGPERACIFEAMLSLDRGRRCCTGQSNASKSSN